MAEARVYTITVVVTDDGTTATVANGKDRSSVTFTNLLDDFEEREGGYSPEKQCLDYTLEEVIGHVQRQEGI